nr:MAG TPA: hypothetical protein [Microviridae sp.]
MTIDPSTAGLITTGVINGATQIGSGIVGLFNNKYNKEQNEWNKNFAREQFDYGKHITENAAQIRALDLEKSGLSKNLAAGDSASSQVSVNSKAEQSALKDFDKKIIDNQLSQQITDIQRTKSESSLNKKKESQIDADIDYTNELKNTELERQKEIQKNIEEKQSNINRNTIQNRLDKYRLDYAERWETTLDNDGIPKDKASMIVRGAQFAISKGLKIVDWLKKEYKYWNELSDKEKQKIASEAQKIDKSLYSQGVY